MVYVSQRKMTYKLLIVGSLLFSQLVVLAQEQATNIVDVAVEETSSASSEFTQRDIDVMWLSHLFWRMEQADIHPMEIEIFCRDALRLVPVSDAAVGRLIEYYLLVKGEVGMSAMAARYALLLNPEIAAYHEHWEEIEEQLDSKPKEPAATERSSEAQLDFEQWMDDAAKQLESGKLINCENLLRSLFFLYPKNREVVKRLGSLYVIRQEWALAAMAYTYAHWLFPEDPDFANNFALSLDKIGRTEDALRTMSEELERFKDSAFHARNCGFLAMKLDRVSEARDYFSRWVELEASEPLAWIQYGLALKEEGKLPFAKVAFQRAYDLDPRRSIPVVELARIAVAKKKGKEVLKWLRNARKVLPPAEFNQLLSDEDFASLGAIKRELQDE